MSPITALVSNSEIKIDLPNIGEVEMAKIQDCIVQLLNEKFFEIEKGKVILTFRYGWLTEVWLNQKKWPNKKNGNREDM